ncbi:hypothetical protein ACFYX0_45595, partial [Streptomyces sp. NPDC002573]
ADRIQAELTVAEREREEWAIARSRVGEVLAPADEDLNSQHDHERCTPPHVPRRSGRQHGPTVLTVV